MHHMMLVLVAVSVALCGCGNDSVLSTEAATATATAAGLKIEDLYVGSGAYPLQGQTVTISYTGTLLDGTKFDSTIDRGQDLRFRLGMGEVIQGLDIGVASMKVGTHRKLTIPPELAYGSKGSSPSIPANATLVFDLWLSRVD